MSSNIRVYDCRNGQEKEITNGMLYPYPILRKDSAASATFLDVEVIPMKVKAADGYRILSATDTAEGGIGCRIVLQQGGAENSNKCHWWISENFSLPTDSNEWKAGYPDAATISVSGGADSSNGATFYLKCNCDELETLGIHNNANLTVDGVVSLISANG